MSRKIIVGNWKMNLALHEASVLVQRLDSKIDPDPNVTIVLAAPFVYLYPLAKDINKQKFKLGAQNLHHLDHGPYTGEVSGSMLKGYVDYVIVGHSERRAMGENDKLVAMKVAAALRHGFTPVLCLGETLTDRHAGHTQSVVTSQLTAALSLLTADDIKHVIIAYEPIWAIGTGDFASPADVSPVFSLIRRSVEELYGEGAATGLRLLYGGSADDHNASAYLRTEGCDGLLPGGASLHYEKFSGIVHAAGRAVSPED